MGNQASEELDLEVHQFPAEAHQIGVPLRMSLASCCATWICWPINSAPVTMKSTATPVLNDTCWAISAGSCDGWLSAAGTGSCSGCTCAVSATGGATAR
jgi:hypothetical protein